MSKFLPKGGTGLCPVLVVLGGLSLIYPAHAGVGVAEADKLGKSLMPLGGIMAGNADNSIPAWKGGMTSDPLYQKGGKRNHLFKGDKPLFSITASNIEQYADKLSDGSKALLKKYPDTYRIDVYPTVRAAAAPQWVYDNTKKNAVNGTLVEGSAGLMPKGVYGGIPFPIPSSGEEVIWNHLLNWRGSSYDFHFTTMLTTSSGQHVMQGEFSGPYQYPYYNPNGSSEKFVDPAGNNGRYAEYYITASAPPVRAGETVLLNTYMDSNNDSAWVYLTGQRRVRKLPNACCDTPHPSSAGLMNFDEIFGFSSRIDRFNWKLVGKRELFIPYNANQLVFVDSPTDAVLSNHINPDYLRWERHRVWAVEATVKEGMRHTSPRSLYYFDEDTGMIVLVDRWDRNGQLWKALYVLPVAMPDVPAEMSQTFGYNDLISGTSYFAGFFGGAGTFEFGGMKPDSVFTAENIASEGVR